MRKMRKCKNARKVFRVGKPLMQQRRGKGSPVFRAPSHRFFADVMYPAPSSEEATGSIRGEVTRLIDDPGRSALLAEILLENQKKTYNIAAEGLRIGDEIRFGREAKVAIGSVVPLGMVPDGTPVFNIELRPGDGGRIARSSGAACYVLTHEGDKVRVTLASKAIVGFKPECRATVGVACGGGRGEKPFKKAGNAYRAYSARGHYYPTVRGGAMSAYDHPHGGRSMGKSYTVARSTPPGRKVGCVAARTTGRRKGKIKPRTENA
jgi:large subunit ribosomal protein L2